MSRIPSALVALALAGAVPMPAAAQEGACDALGAALEAGTLPPDFLEDEDEIAAIVDARSAPECQSVLDEAGIEIPAAGEAAPSACLALNSLTTFGGVPAEYADDEPELAETAQAGESDECLGALDEMGLSAGLTEPNCSSLLLILQTEGLPEAAMADAGALVRATLSASDPEQCAEMVEELGVLR